MESLKLMSILVAVFAFHTSAEAGSGSHGGGGYICPNSSKSEFLDLYEARRGYNISIDGVEQNVQPLKISSSNAPVQEQIQTAFNKLKVSAPVYNAMIETYALVRKARVIPLPADVELAWPSDEQNHYIKAGCAAKGIMLFYDSYDGNDSMDQDTASLISLPNTDQAAAWVHETVYKLLRMTKRDVDSLRARAIVGHLFSNETEEELQAAFDKLGFYLEYKEVGFHQFPENSTHFAYILDSVSEPTSWSDIPVNYEITQLPGDSAQKHCKATAEIDGSVTLRADYYAPYLDMRDVEVMPFSKNDDCNWSAAITDSYGHTINIQYKAAGTDPNYNPFRDLPLILPGNAWIRKW